MAATPDGSIGSRPIDVLSSADIGIIYDGAIPPPPVTEVVLGLDATPIDSGISIPGEIDRFQLSLNRQETVRIETLGDSDTFMTLLGPDDGTREITNNDDGGEGFNARITQTLSAGRYLVEVRLYDPTRTGGYRIQANRIVSAPTFPTLNIGAVPLAASIGAQRESDVYRFVVPSAGGYTIETFGDTDMYLNVFGPDSQTTQIAEDDDSGNATNARLQLDLQPGTYFARVRHYSPTRTGAYQIQVRANDSAPGTPAIPVLTVNAPAVEAEISTPGESDLYRINITAAGRYTVETLGNTDLFLTLLDPSSDSPQLSTDDDSGAGLNPRITIELQPGVYFASVRHYSPASRGTYRIHVTRS